MLPPCWIWNLHRRYRAIFDPRSWGGFVLVFVDVGCCLVSKPPHLLPADLARRPPEVRDVRSISLRRGKPPEPFYRPCLRLPAGKSPDLAFCGRGTTNTCPSRLLDRSRGLDEADVERLGSQPAGVGVSQLAAACFTGMLARPSRWRRRGGFCSPKQMTTILGCRCRFALA